MAHCSGSGEGVYQPCVVQLVGGGVGEGRGVCYDARVYTLSLPYFNSGISCN